MKLGITGSRDPGFWLRRQFLIALRMLAPSEIHHGDCVGIDEFADMIAWDVEAKRVIHPPTNTKLRAFCTIERGLREHDSILPQEDYLARNRAIVDQTDLILACPKQPSYEKGSGTWYTISYALRSGKNVWLVTKDGFSHCSAKANKHLRRTAAHGDDRIS